MTRIESKSVMIKRSAEHVYAFASDLNNFEQLLPKDRITDFKSDVDSCSFKISGMATIGLKKKEEHPPNRLVLESTESPFSFTLDIHIENQGEEVKAYQIANVDLNPMMKMMVQKPLTNLFDHIADRLNSILS
jgi:hypothetical protein